MLNMQERLKAGIFFPVLWVVQDSRPELEEASAVKDLFFPNKLLCLIIQLTTYPVIAKHIL